MPRFLRFGDFRFHGSTRELVRMGGDRSATPVPLGSRACDLLLLFLQRPGELVTKSEIMNAVWPNAAVEDSNLTVQISALRRALDTVDGGASAIQTVPGRGYRFTLGVTGEETEADPSFAPAGPVMLDPAEARPDGSSQTRAASTHPQSNATAATAARSRLRPTAKWMLLGTGVAAVLLAAAAINVNWNEFFAVRSRPLIAVDRPLPPRLSIAVLPFANATGEARNDDLAAMATDDMTTGLSELRGSFVIARSMAQAALARKLPVSEIGKELGVRYVVDGSLRRSPKGVELRIQLNDTVSGASVWTSRFDGSTGDLADLSTQFVQNLMFPLTTELMDAEARRLATLPADALTAQDMLLQVRASVRHQPLTLAKEMENIATLERALMIEPRSAEIMIELANEILRPIADFDDEMERRARLERASGLVSKARAIAGESEPSLGLQARIHRLSGRRVQAVAAYTALLQAHPMSVDYRQGLARTLMGMGRSEDALPLLRDSIKLDRGANSPQDLDQNLGEALVRLGRNEEALDWLRAADEHASESNRRIKFLRAIAYAHSGNVPVARRELEQFVERSPIPVRTLRNYRHTVWPYTALRAEMNRLIDGLAIAGLRDHVDEDVETGLSVAEGLRSGNYHAATPLGAPGISLIRTSELAALMRPADGEQDSGAADAAPLVISNVCRDCFDITLPGAVALPGELSWATLGSPANDEQRRTLKAWVDNLLRGNDTRRLVTVSWSAEFWNARNLAIELANLGYSNVSWYRGGLEAWDAAGLPTVSNRAPQIAEYDEEIRRNPNSAAAYYKRGDAYRALGDGARAVADLSEAIRLDPKLARAYYNRGRAYWLVRDSDRAVANFDDAIKLDPRLAAAFNFRCFAYLLRGNLDRAISDCGTAIELDPTLATPHYHRGRAFSAKDDFGRAIADFTEVIRLDPKFAVAYIERALAYRFTDDLERAVADASKAIELSPNLARGYLDRANSYLAKSDFDRAVADYNDAIHLTPKSTEAFFGRGRAYLYLGDFAKAQADLQYATELNPKFFRATLWLAIAEERGKLPKQFERAAARVDMTAWPAPLVRMLLGQFKPAQALAAADDEDAAIRRRQICEANFYGGQWALSQNARDEASRLFSLAADDCPPSLVERQSAAAELKRLGISR
jgi:tetratricopeptide (TPR) repeat protein/DNA-binding winged helix-turn-helix (wHTH) protein/TolB-like protein